MNGVQIVTISIYAPLGWKGIWFLHCSPNSLVNTKHLLKLKVNNLTLIGIVYLEIQCAGMDEGKSTSSDTLTLKYNTVFLQCVCATGWIGEFCQYVGDACLIKPHSCLNGATCITTSQPSSPPQYTCKCPLGFTGEIPLLCYQFYFDCWQYISKCAELSKPSREALPLGKEQLINGTGNFDVELT